MSVECVPRRSQRPTNCLGTWYLTSALRDAKVMFVKLECMVIGSVANIECHLLAGFDDARILPSAGLETGGIMVIRLSAPSGHSARLLTATCFIVVALAAMIAARHVFARREAETPRIGLPQRALDLGNGDVGDIRDGVFQVSNRGTAPLAVSFRPSCGCSDLRPRVASIPPNEVLDVHVGVRLSEEPAEKVVTIAISSNDPLRPEASYIVRAKCLPPLNVSPIAAHLGSVVTGRTASTKVVIRSRDGASLPPEATIHAESDSPFILTSVTKTEGTGEAFVHIKLSAAAPEGPLQSHVFVRVQPGDFRVSVPVLANVRGDYSAAPSVLRWPDEGRNRELYFIVWRTDGRPLPDIERVEKPKGVSVRAADEGAKRRRYRVTSDDPSAAGSMKLWFAGSAAPVVLRLLPAPSRDEPKQQPEILDSSPLNPETKPS
jgi:hypothetical protein